MKRVDIGISEDTFAKTFNRNVEEYDPLLFGKIYRGVGQTIKWGVVAPININLRYYGGIPGRFIPFDKQIWL